jgi:predicted Abi (CAAX) family protease
MEILFELCEILRLRRQRKLPVALPPVFVISCGLLRLGALVPSFGERRASSAWSVVAFGLWP